MRVVAPVAALAMAAILGLSGAQAAPVSYTDTHLYGSGPGRIDPPGSDAIATNNVTVRDNSATRFSDSFDFSSFVYTTISSISLTLVYNSANTFQPLVPSNPTELWSVRILGSNAAAATDDYFGVLIDTLSPTTYVLTASIDGFFGIDAFANTLSTGKLAFWFSEITGGNDGFNLRSAKIDIAGDLAPVPVPLPAAGLLLVAGFGGLAALRRRRTR